MMILRFAGCVMIVLASMLGMHSCAQAQTRPRVPTINLDPLNLAGKPAVAPTSIPSIDFSSVGKKLQAVAKDIVDKGIADTMAASLDAQNHNDLISKPCWDAQTGFLKQLPVEWQTPPTDIGPALAIQISRDLLNTINGNEATSLKVACAALIGDQLHIINQTLAIVGVAGIGGL